MRSISRCRKRDGRTCSTHLKDEEINVEFPEGRQLGEVHVIIMVCEVEWVDVAQD